MEAFLDNALTERGAVFIGIAIASGEVRGVLDRVGNNYAEAAAYFVGRRHHG